MLLPILLIYFSIPQIFCFFEDKSLYNETYYDYLKAQKRLFNDLFTDYDAGISPVFTRNVYSRTDDPLVRGTQPFLWNYTLFLYYFKLVEVDEPSEKVGVVLEIMEYWYDARLAWNVSNYNNISMIYVRQEKVWSPTFSTFAVNDIQDFRDQDFRLVGIMPEGLVYSYIPARISANCRLDVSHFPFDTQTCQIQISLPIFDNREVKILNEIYSGVLEPSKFEQMGNSEWRILNLSASLEALRFTDAFGNIQLSIFEIKMKRNPLYYIYMIVFPSFIINSLSIIGVFIMESDKMSRLNVGLTNIMTMTFILGVMADKIPKSGEVPLLGIYIIVNLLIMIFAIMVTIMLNRLRKWIVRDKKDRSKSSKLEDFVGRPFEMILITVLHLVNLANFGMILVYWYIT
ncbi:unnamed protein product [Caenorhabditis angaria]|uniref:Neurotransmitter-gated ion-channel ligand-binding domain-containing protein n=1 Tax=Caenorhabditis angaria TaxID=860376 RepID=A0A9P1IUL3_9PELO|nr:unnamed protein product [Caenorhabditis angaria]